MSFQGECHDGARLSVLGSYPAPPGPDWGWRIEVEPGGDTWTLRMFNITPDGQEMKAVETAFTRVA